MKIKKTKLSMLEVMLGGAILFGNPLHMHLPEPSSKEIQYITEVNQSPWHLEEDNAKEENNIPATDILNKQLVKKYIDQALEKYKTSEIIDSEYVIDKINVESSFDRYAKSSVGACGLMQIMESTWENLEKNYNFEENCYNPEINISVGVKLLHQLNRSFQTEYKGWDDLNKEEKLDLISAAYNGGYGRLRNNEWNIDKMPLETRNHVKKLNGNYVPNP